MKSETVDRLLLAGGIGGSVGAMTLSFVPTRYGSWVIWGVLVLIAGLGALFLKLK